MTGKNVRRLHGLGWDWWAGSCETTARTLRMAASLHRVCETPFLALFFGHTTEPRRLRNTGMYMTQ